MSGNVSASPTVLTVGVGEEYSTISAAIAASSNGDVIKVNAGTYTNDFATISNKITLEAVGGVVSMVATEPLPNEKGILVVDNDATIQGFAFSGAEIPASEGNNGAGIRYQAGNLTLLNDDFTHNQDGLLATPEIAGTGTIDIENSNSPITARVTASATTSTWATWPASRSTTATRTMLSSGTKSKAGPR
jgi:hypothetical protein